MAQSDAIEGSLSPLPSDQGTPRAPESTKDDGYLQDTPRKLSDLDINDLENVDGEPSVEMDPRQQMEIEKAMYPGAGTWAKDEERLFEILFLRQDIPLLPTHWDVDFRGVPISEATFQTSDELPPIVYAHSKKEFQATMALTRLIDLTADVRTTSQSGLRQKAPKLIKKGLDQYLNWAAEDGGYNNLYYVPNIVVELIDVVKMDADDIAEFMQRRMRALVQLQRDYLKVDRDPDFWTEAAPLLLDSQATIEALNFERTEKKERHKRSASDAELPCSGSYQDELAPREWETPKGDRSVKKMRRFKAHSTSTDELIRGHDRIPKPEESVESHSRPHTPETSQTPDTPETPELPSKSPPKTFPMVKDKQECITDDFKYTREPPVVYGLFILNTSVLLLTADSAKGEDGYVSFHLEMDFMDRQQSVWNALTVAIATCLARDELRARSEDFDALPTEEESDPDI